MSIYRGPNIVQDGLILHLDAANSKSFRGEPTTNYLTTSNVIGFGSSWTLQSYLYNNNPIYKNVVTNPNAGNNAGFRLSGTVTLNQSGPKYLTISFSKKLITTYGRNLGGYITVYYTDSSYEDLGWSYNQPSWAQSDLGIWTKIYSTVTLNASKTPNYVSVFYVYCDFAASGEMDVSEIQLEQKSYSTPFVNGTRGTTVATGGGWTDLSGNENHGTVTNNLGSSIFNNTYALNFDAIGKKITGTIINNQPTTNATIESWVFPKTELEMGDGMGTIIIISGGASIYQSLFKSDPPQLANYWYSHTPEGYHINGSSNRNQWHHWCSVWNYNDQKLYQFVDGIKVSSINTYGNAASGSNYTIGYEGSSRQFSGGIANIKVYNIALSDSQVLQNFNAHKKRFGL
jgi:hypothetical protein